MPIGITEDHEALRLVVRRFVETNCAPAVARAALDAPAEERPPFWAALAAPGWLGLHIAEAFGGAGYGMVEQCVVIEELGRAAAPGPYLPTVLASAVVQAGETGIAARTLLPGLAAGAVVGAVALDGELVATPDGDALTVSGALRPVLGAHLADVIIAAVRVPGADLEWVALDVASSGDALRVAELPSLDRTRRVASVEVKNVPVPASARLGPIDPHVVRSTAAVSTHHCPTPSTRRCACSSGDRSASSRV